MHIQYTVLLYHLVYITLNSREIIEGWPSLIMMLSIKRYRLIIQDTRSKTEGANRSRVVCVRFKMPKGY